MALFEPINRSRCCVSCKGRKGPQKTRKQRWQAILALAVYRRRSDRIQDDRKAGQHGQGEDFPHVSSTRKSLHGHLAFGLEVELEQLARARATCRG